MATKDWKKSKTNDLWFFKQGKGGGRNGTDRATETLNAVKFGTDYDIFSGRKKIKRVKSREQALGFMSQYMRNN